MAVPGTKPSYKSLSSFKDVMLIGKGQFSTVYRAKSILDHTPVALKKIQVGHPPPATSGLWAWCVLTFGVVLCRYFKWRTPKRDKIV